MFAYIQLSTNIYSMHGLTLRSYQKPTELIKKSVKFIEKSVKFTENKRAKKVNSYVAIIRFRNSSRRNDSLVSHARKSFLLLNI